MLGLQGLLNVALSFVASDLAPPGEAGDRLLRQSLRRAEAARLLAVAVDAAGPEEFFSVGLLLEIGLSVDMGEPGSGFAIAALPAKHRLVHERAAGRVVHPKLGQHLATSYGLPPQFAAAIAAHHADSPEDGLVCRIAWAAERLAGLFESAGAGARDAVVGDLSRVLEVPASRIVAALEALPDAVVTLSALFERDLGPQLTVEALQQQANAQLLDLNEQYAETIGMLQRALDEKEALAQQLKALNKQLEHQATTDALTGLPNRRLMEMSLQRDLAKCAREGEPFALVMLDVDHFKRFNDTYGHELGDRVLRRVGDALNGAARRSDLAARFGGEEFCVLLPNTDVPGAELVAERLRTAIERTFLVHEGERLQVTASFGIAVRAGTAQEGASALIQRADAALYAAKRGGRNRVALAPDPTLASVAPE